MKNRKQISFFLALTLILTIFTGCAAKSAHSSQYDGAYVDVPAYEPEPAEAPAAAEEAANDFEAGYSTQEAKSSTAFDPDEPVPAPDEEAPVNGAPTLADKIIYSGDLYIETTKFDDAIAAIEAKVKEFGGFVESSNISGRTEYRADGTTALVDRNAFYVVRVPCAKFDAFLKHSGTIGNVLSSNTNAENITSQFTDAEARKASLKVQEERLLAMMEKTDDIESLIALEERLSEVRYEYEGIERRLINWQNQVDYSTVSLQLQEVAVYTPVAPVQRTFGEKLVSALSDGWNGFVRFCEGLVLGLAEALPILILLALLIVAVVLIVRAVNRRRKVKREARYKNAVPTAVAVPAEPKPEEPEKK